MWSAGKSEMQNHPPRPKKNPRICAPGKKLKGLLPVSFFSLKIPIPETGVKRKKTLFF